MPPVKNTEITVNGNKKVMTLRKDFNKKFPYLSICICDLSAKTGFENNGIRYEVDDNKTISEVRHTNSPKDLSISGNKKVKTLEKEFEESLGLFVKVCYRETVDCRYPTWGSEEEKTLSSLNELCKERGCIKDAWK